VAVAIAATVAVAAVTDIQKGTPVSNRLPLTPSETSTAV